MSNGGDGGDGRVIAYWRCYRLRKTIYRGAVTDII